MEGAKKAVPRRESKKDRLNALLAVMQKWASQGLTIDDMAEKGFISEKQWDFLIDCGVNDVGSLTTSQQEAAQAVTRAPRPVFPNGYNKKYPKEKQELYGAIRDFLCGQGADVTPRAKENFRDLDFTLGGKAYKIVLSEPRESSK